MFRTFETTFIVEEKVATFGGSQAPTCEVCNAVKLLQKINFFLFRRILFVNGK